MSGRTPALSVVFATHNRSARLEQLLESLAAQTLAAEEFEVVVVDDCSGDGTPDVLARAVDRWGARLTTVRFDRNRGPAAARNAGWRSARAPLVAFTDDDCVASPAWLEAYLAAARAHPGALLQGRTEPRPDELDEDGPFSRTLRVRELGPYYQTCNVFYPRALLERVGGFDEQTFSVPGGEDADLAWRTMGTGASALFVDTALMHHAVTRLGPVGKLKVAWRWSETVKIFSRHPRLRRGVLVHGVFWKGTHYILVRLLVAVMLGRAPGALRWWLALPYLRHLVERGRVDGGGVALAPFYVVHDLVEIAAMVRGSVRYRTLVL